MLIPKALPAAGKRRQELRRDSSKHKDPVHHGQGELITINPVGEEDSLKKEIRKILKGHGKDFDDGVYRLKVIDVTTCNSNKICVY